MGRREGGGFVYSQYSQRLWLDERGGVADDASAAVHDPIQQLAVSVLGTKYVTVDVGKVTRSNELPSEPDDVQRVLVNAAVVLGVDFPRVCSMWCD